MAREDAMQGIEWREKTLCEALEWRVKMLCKALSGKGRCYARH